MPFTQRELDTMQCSIPDCTEQHGELWLHSRCHMNAPLKVKYENGVVSMYCAECEKFVIDVRVAP